MKPGEYAFKTPANLDQFMRFPGTNLGEYWFPLRPELQVKLTLPLDLSAKEVERLKLFLTTLVNT